MPLLCCGAAQADAVDVPQDVQIVIPPAPAPALAPSLEGFTLTERGKPHCWEPVCARAAGEAAIRINHYGHAPLTEQNHTYIGPGEKLVGDHWAASLAQSFENR